MAEGGPWSAAMSFDRCRRPEPGFLDQVSRLSARSALPRALGKGSSGYPGSALSHSASPPKMGPKNASMESPKKINFYRELFLTRYYQLKNDPWQIKTDSQEADDKKVISCDDNDGKITFTIPSTLIVESDEAYLEYCQTMAHRIHNLLDPPPQPTISKNPTTADEAKPKPGLMKAEPFASETAKEAGKEGVDEDEKVDVTGRLDDDEVKKEDGNNAQDDQDQQWSVPQFIKQCGRNEIECKILCEICAAIENQHLVNLATEETENGAIARFNALVYNSSILRRTFTLIATKPSYSSYCHWMIIKHVPKMYLAVYISLLQALKIKAPYLVDFLLKPTGGTQNCIKNGIIEELRVSIITKRPFDPLHSTLAENLPKKYRHRAHFVLISPTPTVVNAPATEYPGDYIYKVLLPAMGKCSHIKLNIMKHDSPSDDQVDELVQDCINHIKARLIEIKKQFRDSNIILVGWDTSSALASAVSLEVPVQALILFSFSNITLSGLRGEVDDDMLDIVCPTLFVVGQDSPNLQIDHLQDTRELMRSGTGLIVIGGADHHLRLSYDKLRLENVTQKMADRSVINCVWEFLNYVAEHNYYSANNSIPSSNVRSHPIKRRKTYAYELTQNHPQVVFNLEKKAPSSRPASNNSRPASASSSTVSSSSNQPPNPTATPVTATPAAHVASSVPAASSPASLAAPTSSSSIMNTKNSSASATSASSSSATTNKAAALSRPPARTSQQILSSNYAVTKGSSARTSGRGGRSSSGRGGSRGRGSRRGKAKAAANQVVQTPGPSSTPAIPSSPSPVETGNANININSPNIIGGMIGGSPQQQQTQNMDSSMPGGPGIKVGGFAGGGIYVPQNQGMSNTNTGGPVQTTTYIRPANAPGSYPPPVRQRGGLSGLPYGAGYTISRGGERTTSARPYRPSPYPGNTTVYSTSSPGQNAFGPSTSMRGRGGYHLASPASSSILPPNQVTGHRQPIYARVPPPRRPQMTANRSRVMMDVDHVPHHQIWQQSTSQSGPSGAVHQKIVVTTTAASKDCGSGGGGGNNYVTRVSSADNLVGHPSQHHQVESVGHHHPPPQGRPVIHTSRLQLLQSSSSSAASHHHPLPLPSSQLSPLLYNNSPPPLPSAPTPSSSTNPTTSLAYNNSNNNNNNNQSQRR